MDRQNIMIDIDEKLAQKPAYKKMLNNLLGISSRDNSTFASSKVNNFDLIRLLSDSDLKKAFNNKTFSITITDISDDIMVQNLIKSSDVDEFIDIADEEGFQLTITDRKLLEKSFKESKDKIITKLKKQKNQKIAKWKRFKNKYLDKQAQTNSWPLYIGSMFLKVRTTSTSLYAPLIMKKVGIEITRDNKVKINSIDEFVDINEKLLFLLQNEYKLNVPDISEEKQSSGVSISEAIEIIKPAFDEIIENDIDFIDKFEYLTKGDVKNQDLQYDSGIILTLSSPSGGGLRDKLIDILMNDEPDDLLDIDVLRPIEDEITDDIKAGKGVYRITPTDLSQERAIIGSLKDNSIIWGPPGTGKSQTIANILANILINENTAVVTSEKKAALDVIQKRMGVLSKYMFFGLTDKNIDKKAFYKPFNDLVEKVTNTHSSYQKEAMQLIPEEEWKLLSQSEKLKDKDLEAIAKVYNKILGSQILRETFGRHHKDLLKHKVLFNNPSFSASEALTFNGYVKKGLLFKRYPKDVRALIKNWEHFKNEEMYKYLLKIEDIRELNKVSSYIENEKNAASKKIKFVSDIEYIDQALAERFRDRIEELSKKPDIGKRMKTFLKNCASGHRVPYKFVHIYKDILMNLFDVFVSTPQTLASTIDMDFKYDYAIFDEASQLHLEKAIPFISVAGISIIAGDNMQMRPTSYFGVRDKTTLYDEAEEDVDSLLDFAYNKGLNKREYMLTKNYRSKNAELMTFSSKEFYNSELDVVDSAGFGNKEAIEVYESKGKWESRINTKEAEDVLDKLLEVESEYESIILLTLNSTQKQYIENLIYTDQYSEISDMIGEGKVVLRNLENIQGDEADLVIVSVAYDKTAKLGSTYVAKPEGKNALNVAISRAVEKMIVFKSIGPSEVNGNSKNDSIRVFRDWLSFLESSQEERTGLLLETNKKAEHFDSEFEEDVYDELADKIRTTEESYIQTQFPVGSYLMDMAIFSSDGRFLMGIEVDGYKYHSGYEKMIKDKERQMFIESKGYSPIYRVTELNWRINKDKVIEEINDLL